MDVSSIAEFVKTYLLPHYPFILIAFILGMAGNVFKNKVWTKQRAARSRFAYWIRAFLPLHAPFIGALIGLAGKIVLADSMPVSPGISAPGDVVLYYAGAGAFSAWVFNAFKHFAESRGVEVPDALDGDSDTPPPPSVSEPPQAA